MFKLEITGTVALLIEGRAEQPVTYEFSFDHMKVAVEGIEPAALADAVAIAVHKAMLPTDEAVINELNKLFTEGASDQAKAWMLALVRAEQEMTNAESWTGAERERYLDLAAQALAGAGMSPAMTYQQVRNAAAHLHSTGGLPPYALVGA